MEDELAKSKTEQTIVSALVVQVEALSNTLQTLIQQFQAVINQKNLQLEAAANRFNELSAQYLDQQTELRDTISQLQSLKENFLVALEALHKTIDESDRNLDDQAKITQRIGQMELTYERALAQANAPNQ